MTLLVLLLAAWVLLTVDGWHRTRPEPPPPPGPRPPARITLAARPLPPVRIADIADPWERWAAACAHTGRTLEAAA